MMSDSNKSVDRHVRELEQRMAPSMARLSPTPVYASGVNLALHEQALGLIRSLYWQEIAREHHEAPVSDCGGGACFTITLQDPDIKLDHTGRIEDDPLNCVQPLAVIAGVGRATFVLCCEGGDCTAKVKFIVHPQGQPDTVVYEEVQTVTCGRGSDRTV